MKLLIGQDMIKESMKKAQNKVKTYGNKVKSFREFNVGGMVFFEVASKISQLKLGKNYKLSTRSCKQFQILGEIEIVAYEMDLPPT